MGQHDINRLDLNKTYSYADYLLWKFQERIELIKGKVFKMSPAPSSEHQYIVSILNFHFYRFLKGKPCKVFPAPFDVRFAKSASEPDSKVFNVVQPDLTVVCDVSKIDEKGCYGAPDLIVEVVSKSSVAKDLHEKFDLYEANGVCEYWIVHPNDKTLNLYTLSEKGKYQSSKLLTRGDVATSTAIHGFEIDLNELFEDLVKDPEEIYTPTIRRI